MAIQISSIVNDLRDADVAVEQIELYLKTRTPAQEAADIESGATSLLVDTRRVIQSLRNIIGKLEV